MHPTEVKIMTRRFCSLLILLTLSITASQSALACKCMNKDIHALYAQSDIVILGSGEGTLVGDKQKLQINTLIKGEIPEGGLYVSQQKNSCRYDQLPLNPQHAEYLLLLKTENGENKLTARCYTYYNNNGYYSLRLSAMDHAHIHSAMIPPFLHNKGAQPDISLYFSLYKNLENGKADNQLSITNQGRKPLELFHPSNRRAYTFNIVDGLGNIVPPQGFAKVDPAGGIISLAVGGAYNYDLRANSIYSFPYLSGTALFGYALKPGESYTVSVTYRPYGGRYGAITSEERSIKY
jgi:hypothetical protein